MRVTFSLRFLLLTFAAVACGIAAYFYNRGLHETHNDFDLAIVGEGYFQVIDASEKSDSMCHYTRSGKLRIDSDGRLSLRDQDRDWIIEPAICVPADWTEFVVRENGEVWIFEKGERKVGVWGQLQLSKFPNEKRLVEEWREIYTANDETGQADSFSASADSHTMIRQGWLDESNHAGNPIFATIVFSVGMLIAIGSELKGLRSHFLRPVLLRLGHRSLARANRGTVLENPAVF